MRAGRFDFTIEQGIQLNRTLTYTDSDGDPIDLTGYTARMDIRESVDAAGVILTLNTTNGYLVLGGAAGTVQMLVPSAITEALDFTQGCYDLELVAPSGEPERLVEGLVDFSPEVTRTS